MLKSGIFASGEIRGKSLGNGDLVGGKGVAFVTGIVIHHDHVFQLLDSRGVPVLLKPDAELAADRLAFIGVGRGAHNIPCPERVVFDRRIVGRVFARNGIFVIIGHKQVLIGRAARNADIAVAVGKLDHEIRCVALVRNKLLVLNGRRGRVVFFLHAGISAKGKNGHEK